MIYFYFLIGKTIRHPACRPLGLVHVTGKGMCLLPHSVGTQRSRPSARRRMVKHAKGEKKSAVQQCS